LSDLINLLKFVIKIKGVMTHDYYYFHKNEISYLCQFYEHTFMLTRNKGTH